MTAAAGWYHCSVKPVSRSTGRSAVAAAAYRLGDRLHDEALDQTHDYTRRSGVVTTFALAPEGSPDWALDPETLWNAAEAAERRRNSQVAREYELALPSAVSGEEREAIARGFAQHLVDRYGVAVTAAIHEPSRYGDDRNFHAHILTTTRSMDEGGLGKKTRILDDRKTGPQEILHLRGYAADLINDALERAGVDERVDHRSFETRGIDREATEHLGPTASEMERRGEETERGSRNRDIGKGNQTLDELVSDLAGIEAEIVAEQERRLSERYRSPQEAARAPYLSGDPTSPGLWESLKQAARSAFGLREPSAATESTEPLTGDNKREARDPFADPGVAEAHLRDGEIPQGGLGMTWWQRAAVFMTELGEQAVEAARNVWERHVERRREAIDKGIDQSPDDGPDCEIRRNPATDSDLMSATVPI